MLGNVYLPSTPDWALEVSEGLYKAFRRRYTDRLATTPQEIAAVKEFQASNRLKYKMLMSIKE